MSSEEEKEYKSWKKGDRSSFFVILYVRPINETTVEAFPCEEYVPELMARDGHGRVLQQTLDMTSTRHDKH